jgi:hypothetical protein
MSLHNYWIARRQRRCRVTTSNRESRGKLLAPKTTTGPKGRSMERISGLGAGLRSGSAWSIRASTHDPSSDTWANSRSCAQVRAISPCRRACGSAVSRAARSITAAATLQFSSRCCAAELRAYARMCGCRPQKHPPPYERRDQLLLSLPE